MFEDCSVNLSGSCLSNVGRDQTNVDGDQHIHHTSTVVNINIPATASNETVQHVVNTFCHGSRQHSPYLSVDFTSNHQRSVCIMASQIVLEIIQWLDRLKEITDYLYLKELLLEPLRRILSLTDIAIQVFEDTPLGQYLSASINPEAAQCLVTLQLMLDRINRYRCTLASTPIRDLWPLVLWSDYEVLGLTWRLTAHRDSLGQYLVSLNSIMWDDLGHKLRAGSVSLKKFRAFVSRGPASLRHIQVTSINVVDHLGKNLPVPTMFCTSWKEFDYIIKGYCRSRPGHLFVNRGDYQVIHAKNSQTVDPSEFVNEVKPETKLEMSIVFRRRTPRQNNTGICPQCRCVNSKFNEMHGWIKCRQCSGQFQTEEAVLNERNGRTNKASSTSEERGKQAEADNAEKVEEIMSPSSQARDGVKAVPTASGQSQTDSIQLFRRVLLICHSRHRPHTVTELTRDRSSLDITKYIQRDLPDHQFPIGVGASSNVFKGIYQQQDPVTKKTQSVNVVIKCLVDTRSQRRMLEERLNRKIACWRHLNHPNVSKLLGIAYLHPEAPPGLVSQYVLRRDFLAYIGRHPELKCEKAQEIARGLEYLHENHVVHGDIKVHNIIVSDHGTAQITDFGAARILDVEGFDEMIYRNVRYSAPELRLINTIEEGAELLLSTTQSDIYSMGILLLQLFHGPDRDGQRGWPYNHIPYSPATGDYALLLRIHRGERPLRDRYNFIEDHHWGIMQRCWAGDPMERPGITEVRLLLGG